MDNAGDAGQYIHMAPSGAESAPFLGPPMPVGVGAMAASVHPATTAGQVPGVVVHAGAGAGAGAGGFAVGAAATRGKGRGRGRGRGRARAKGKRGGANGPAKPRPVVVPPFLSKTYAILSNPNFHNLISWNDAGDGIIVSNVQAFSETVLPLYFKHSRWTSFVRQLHIYGFKKWAGKDVNVVEFRNPQFRRSGRDSLHTIKRRVMPSGVEQDPTRPKRRRRAPVLTIEQAQLLMVALAKQQEVLQRVERLEAANHHLSNVNECLSWEILRLRRSTRKPMASVCTSASRICASSGMILVDQLQRAAAPMPGQPETPSSEPSSAVNDTPRSVASSRGRSATPSSFDGGDGL